MERNTRIKMIIHILFTCDDWKSSNSRCLRGVFTDLELLEEAKEELIKNGVVEERQESDEEDKNFDVVSIEENEYEPNGSYY